MEGTFETQSITAELAQTMVAAAVAKARAMGVLETVAVLDVSGHLKAFCRMDGAPLVGIELSQDKAYTALSGLSSDEMYKFIKDDPMLLTGVPRISRFSIIGGGLAIRIGGAVVGGIGASGGTPEQDCECARAGLNAIG